MPDLITGWEQGGVSRVYIMRREEGQLPTWNQIDAGPAPDVEDALFFDANQDGAMDVVSSTEGKNKKILIHWAPTDPRNYVNSSEWATETLYEDGSQWMYALAMDIDGRNGTDLVVGGKNQDGKIGWLECPENPRNTADWKFHYLSEAGWTMSLIAEDMDKDGDLDILLSDRRSSLMGVRWLENPGSTSPALTNPWTNRWVAKGLNEAMLIDTHDFDNDGTNEIVVPSYVDDIGHLSIFKNTGNDVWNEIKLTYPGNMGRAKAAIVGDIDHNGTPDIVLSTEFAENRSGIVWLEYRGSWDNPDWIVHDVSGPEGIKFDLNLLLDLDGDGDLDIINTEENNNSTGGVPGLGLVWYENPGGRSH